MYICPNCQKTFDTPVRFCTACGTLVTEQVAQPETQTVTESFDNPEYTMGETTVLNSEPVEQVISAPEEIHQAEPVYVQSAAPQVPVQPQYQPPVQQNPYVQNQYPQNQYYQYPAYTNYKKPSLAKTIVGMILSITGLEFASIGVLYTLLGMSTKGVGFVMGIIFFSFNFPLSLIGLIMSNGAIKQGSTSKMSSVGKTLGIIGIILAGITMLLGILNLGIGY